MIDQKVKITDDCKELQTKYMDYLKFVVSQNELAMLLLKSQKVISETHEDVS